MQRGTKAKLLDHRLQGSMMDEQCPYTGKCTLGMPELQMEKVCRDTTSVKHVDHGLQDSMMEEQCPYTGKCTLKMPVLNNE